MITAIMQYADNPRDAWLIPLPTRLAAWLAKIFWNNPDDD